MKAQSILNILECIRIWREQEHNARERGDLAAAEKHAACAERFRAQLPKETVLLG